MSFHEIYASGAEGYQALVGAEDADGNLPSALGELIAPGTSTVEIGAGTGRVTRILSSLAIPVVATEPSPAMQKVATQLGLGPTTALCRAEAAALPFAAGSFGCAVAGWVFGHYVEWQPDGWRHEIGRFLAECERVTNGGRVIVVETLGTGHELPSPPTPLVDYYRFLEQDHGFERQWIRTDYSFATIDEAATVCGAFFGAEFEQTVRAKQWSRVPECTGIWSRPGSSAN